MDPAQVPYRVETIAANGLNFETAVLGDGPKLALLLHGFPETHFSWRYQMPLLAEKGYTVWAPNLRGYGQTTRPSAVADYRLPHLLEDVAGLFDEAGARGLKPSLVMAHDWGGLIGWSFVLKAIRPVERFVAINIPHPALFAQRFWTLSQLRKSWYIFAFQIPGLAERQLTANDAAAIDQVFIKTVQRPEAFPPEVRRVFRDNAMIPGCARAMVNYYRANAGHRATARDMATPRSTDVPTLMIWGEADIALGLELTEGTERLVPNLTFVPLPGVSHWAQQEAPEACNRAISNWLDA